MDDVKTATDSLITALQARERSLSVNNSLARAELSRIGELIDSATAEGRTRIQLEKQLMPSVKRHLEAKGYKVEFWSDQRENVSYTSVDWGGC